MKIGDNLPVYIDGIAVAQAVIQDITDGEATLVIPATRLVVRINQSLDFAAQSDSGTEHQLLGVEEDGDSGEV